MTEEPNPDVRPLPELLAECISLFISVKAWEDAYSTSSTGLTGILTDSYLCVRSRALTSLVDG